MNNVLTAAQQQVLFYMIDHLKQHSYLPSVLETSEVFGMYPNGVYCHIKALVKKGYLNHAEGRHRGNTPTQKGFQMYDEFEND